MTTEATCSLAVLCTAEGGYDATDGNPAGSYAANTTIGLNVTTLFKSAIAVQSPDFTVANAGDGTLHLDRQFVPGALVDLAPEATYAVNLIDRTAGSTTEVMKETLTGESPFTGKDHAVSVKVGHTYALSIKTEVSSTIAGTGLVGGATSVRFDNVAVTVQQAPGGTGAGTGSGAGGLTNQQLQALIGGSGSLVGPAVLKGGRLFVKVRCPKKAGGTCKVALRGLLKKRRPATSTRRVKIRKGKVRRVMLKVKPRARKRVGARRKLLFKETVRVGRAHATVYKRLKLIRR